MTKFKLLGAAAVILSSALTVPAMAQQAMAHPGACERLDQNGNCLSKKMHGRQHVVYRQDGWNNSYNRVDGDVRGYGWTSGDSGFWPADAAADVVGGAVGTADAVLGGAIGTADAVVAAPFGGPYASYDNGYRGGSWYNQSYAQRNNFVCQPGTWFRGEDGRRHICQ
jgi:hypothetical protein